MCKKILKIDRSSSTALKYFNVIAELLLASANSLRIGELYKNSAPHGRSQERFADKLTNFIANEIAYEFD